MHPLERAILETIRQRQLLHDGERVVVGVSGGADSMSLLHVLAKIAKELSFGIVVAHINHLLRSEEADREEALVEDQATLLGLPCRITRVRVEDMARRQGLSVEHAGRLVRYDFFAEIARQFGAAKIAVAHTADDQAEEILLRMLRGTGRKGLSGMDYCRDKTIIRPLLDTPKADLIDYLNDLRIPYLEDSSNQQQKYLRNRVRHELLPFLEQKFNPDIRATLRRTAAILKEEDEYLDEAARAAYPLAVVEERTSAGDFPVLTLRKGAILDLPRAISRRLIEAMLIRLSIQPGFEQIEAVLRFCRTPGGSGGLHLQDGLRVRNSLDRLFFSFPRGRHGGRGNLVDDPQPVFCVVVQEPGEIIIPEIQSRICLELLLSAPDPKKLTSGESVFLDAGKIAFPLIIRNRNTGDRLRPLGGPGSRKLSDILIDWKIPLKTRRFCPVLLTGGEIACVLGLGVIDQAYKITESTRMSLKVTVQKI